MLTIDTNILLVDDFDLMRKMLRTSLNEMGYTKIDDANDGDVAIEMIKKAYEENRPYGAVFLDWVMPIKPGIEVLEWCRSQPEFNDLIIVMVTAEAEKKYVFKALTTGANDYIVKPCSLSVLKSKIEYINKNLKKVS